jgi:hypothetical protein
MRLWDSNESIINSPKVFLTLHYAQNNDWIHDIG